MERRYQDLKSELGRLKASKAQSEEVADELQNKLAEVKRDTRIFRDELNRLKSATEQDLKTTRSDLERSRKRGDRRLLAEIGESGLSFQEYSTAAEHRREELARKVSELEMRLQDLQSQRENWRVAVECHIHFLFQ